MTAFTENSTTGALTAVTGSNPFTLTNGNNNGMAVDPSGKFLYGTACTNPINAVTINSSTGGLTDVSGQPFGSSECYGSIAITH